MIFNGEKHKLFRSILMQNTSRHDRMMLMIYLMIEDEYNAQDIYNIINDVLYVDQWDQLRSKLEVSVK